MYLAEIFGNDLLIFILIGAVALLAAILIVPRKWARRSPMLHPVRNPRESERDLEDAVDVLLVKLHEAGQEINAKVDTKMAALNALIEEADRKTAELRLAMGKAQTARGIPSGAKPASEAKAPRDSKPRNRRVAKSGKPPREETHEQIYELADTGADAVAISRKTGIARGEVELILQLRGK